MNETLRNDGKPPLYCQPDRLALNVDNYRHIALEEFVLREAGWLKNELAKDNGGALLLIALLDGLKRTFPCR